MDQQQTPLLASQDETASSEASFGDILSQFERQHHGEESGQALEAVVVAVSGDFVFCDVGRKLDGVLPAERVRDASGEITVKPGDKMFVQITGRNAEGYYVLSTVKVERPKDWSSLERAFAEGRAIAGVVEEVIKGGLRVDVGARAFLPASRSGARDAAEMEKLVGQEIQCKIIKLDVGNEDVVLDRRAILEEEEKRAKEQRFAALNEGDLITGTVRNLTDFGAFVDIGGVDGLLHVTDMSWGRVEKPSDLLSSGQQVEVKILKINRDTRKISLGLKQLQPDPWTTAAEKYKTGDRVQGKVVRLTDFGAFVELDPGVDGLIHLSEMSWSKKVKKPSDVVKTGELVDVVILGVNTADKRISLGLKQALGDPWEEAAKKYAPGTAVEAPVISLANFGAFVDLGNGIEGMIHIGDITSAKRLNHPKEALAVGQKVRAMVLELDSSKRRIRLGMKQLEPTTMDDYIAGHKLGEVVTGRILDAGKGRARIELGEGVIAECRLPVSQRASERPAAEAPADLSSLTAMLAAKWKGGRASATAADDEPMRAGQIRSFRIAALDSGLKRVEVELT